MLRPYQQRSIDELYLWFKKNRGNPCLVLPTGSGKSHIVAALCKDALQSWPETRILMLTHVKELIEQNSEKMRQHWPNAPLGIYSAALNRRNFDAITFAGIMSVRDRANEIGHVDLVIIDECHLVSHKDEGSYRQLINDLTAISPNLRVIGLTATPWRLGHGRISEGDALFNGLIEPVSIEELIEGGYLSILHSKITSAKISADGVGKRGGEYIESQLQKAVDKKDLNDAVVREVIRLAGNRKSWLFFCTGVDHALHIRDALMENGIIAETITGKTPKSQREGIIRDFKSGSVQALTNANVLTTGFDYPDIDLIALLRPTMSPSLYVQMAGRGMRPKSHTDHCLVLDFAGVVQTHGPIVAINSPNKKGEGTGEAPVKVCDNCGELCHPTARICPTCDAEFPPPKKEPLKLHDDDIMGKERTEMEVSSWDWTRHISRSSGKEMLRVTYYGDLSEKPVREYLPVKHEGYAGQKSISQLLTICQNSGASIHGDIDLHEASHELNKSIPPSMIKYRRDGKFFKVTERIWDADGTRRTA
jgi:DNA repair protein RadD